MRQRAPSPRDPWHQAIRFAHSQLICDGEVELFQRPEDVVCALEPIDALDGDYRLFDATGLVLNVTATGVHRTRWTVSGGLTLVTVPDPSLAQPEVLAGELRAYLVRAFGLADSVTELPSLIELAQAHIGFRRPPGRGDHGMAGRTTTCVHRRATVVA